MGKKLLSLSYVYFGCANVRRYGLMVFQPPGKSVFASSSVTATPANWTDGKDVIIGAAVTDEEAKTLFPGGWKTIKPYLRTLAQPK